MTLTRIGRIKGYRIFRDFSWPATLPDFTRFNVVYGWNGSGKTTLSALLRQAQLKKPLDDGTVEFIFGDARVSSSDLDKVPTPHIRVFNRDYVSRAVFETGGTQFPPVYYFGEDSAEKQRQIKDLADKRDTQRGIQAVQAAALSQTSVARDAFATEQAKSIKNLLTVAGGGPYNNYNAANFKADTQRLALLQSLPMSLTDAVRQAHLKMKDSRALAKLSLVPVSFPDLSDLRSRTTTMLKRSVVSSVLEELVQDSSVGAWVAEGLLLHQNSHQTETCRFCAQPLPKERIAHLEAHFNDEFNQFKRDVANLIIEVERALIFEDSFTAPPKEALYEALQNEYEAALRELRSNSKLLKGALDALKQALVAKQDEPFKQIELDNLLRNIGEPKGIGAFVIAILAAAAESAPFLASFAGTTALRKVVGLISRHNELTESFDTAVKDARAALAQDEVLGALDDWDAKCQAVDVAERAGKDAREEAEKIEREIAKLEAEVKQHHRPADELTKEIAAYLGRSELRFEPEQNGYRITRAGQPAMDLSDGEKTAIAFLYFLKSLQGTDFSLTDGVVVIDDPVSSLDANSLFSAFSFMKDRTMTAKQVIILTHNFTFFRLIRNWFDGLNRKKEKPASFYMLSPTLHAEQRGAKIALLDPFLSDFESEYHYLFKRVFLAAQLQQGGSLELYYGMPNMARRLLETFLAYRVPQHSGDLFHKLNAAAGDVAVKTRILRFLHTFSHADAVAQTEHDPSVLSETPAVMRDVLALVHMNDSVHHDAMVDLVNKVNVS